MPTYPATLPPPVIVDYSVSDAPMLVMTAGDGGPHKRQQVSSHFMSRGNASIVVDKPQADAFRAVLAETNHGASWLTGMPMDTGLGLADHRVRVSNVRWTVAGMVPSKNWKITFSFETDERNGP